MSAAAPGRICTQMSNRTPMKASGMADARWATVLIDPETHEPREATQGELEEIAELGIAVERCWIAPGPLEGEAP
jgi:hypothetical protein